MFCGILGITGVDGSSEFALSWEKNRIIPSHAILEEGETLCEAVFLYIDFILIFES